jgi:hypothetical protein
LPSGIYQHKKGYKIINRKKPIPFTEEHKKKISDKMKGKRPKNFEKSILPFLFKKNHIVSKEVSDRISIANKGKHLSVKTEFKKGLISFNKGKKLPQWSGENSARWKGGISKDKKHYKRQRRNREYNAEGSHTKGEWELLKKQYGYRCPCCGRYEPETTLTEDHIIPLAKGGSDYIENIQPLCKSCNCKKYLKIIKYIL